MNLKVSEIYTLKNELEGLLKEELEISQRHHLKEIQRKASDELRVSDELREELIKKFGKEENGNIYVNPKDRENFNQFVKEWEKVLLQKKEVSFPKFNKENFLTVKTKVDLDILFLL